MSISKRALVAGKAVLGFLVVTSLVALGQACAQQVPRQVVEKANPRNLESVLKETPPNLEWRELNPAIQIVRFELTAPRPLSMVAAKIDLSQNLEFFVTRGNGEREKETDGLRTSSFLKNYQCDLAINAAPFAPVMLFENGAMDVAGWQVADGEEVSPADNKRPALVILKDGTARIFGRPPEDRSNVMQAVTGFELVLRDGTAQGQQQPLHPRTAAGLSRDRQTMVLLVVDGRQRGTSEGLSTQEVGQMLAWLGMHRGINLDGGGTTTMVARLPADWAWRNEQDPASDANPARTQRSDQRINRDSNSSQGSEKPDRSSQGLADATTGSQRHATDTGPEQEIQVLNTPIQAGVPGLERPSASHFGVRFVVDAKR